MSKKETPQQNARGTECTRSECPNTNADCHTCKYAKPIKLENTHFADFDAELFDGIKTKMTEAFRELGHADSDWWVEGGLITFSFRGEDERDEFLEEIGITFTTLQN